MDGDLTEDVLSFDNEEVKTLIEESVEGTLKDCTQYIPSKADTWTAAIIELCLKRLQSLNKPFKYVVTSILVQNTGNGMHSACCSYWDVNTDGYARYVFENGAVQCVTAVYGMAI